MKTIATDLMKDDLIQSQTQQSNLPLVSCLCVTHQKPGLLAKAVACFLHQSYPFKQLVIVYENIDLLTKAYVKDLRFIPEIKLVRVDSLAVKKTLGELRNIAVEEADGEYVCQWDDDDWYHSDRISRQMQSILESDKPASILNRWLVHNTVDQKFYYSHERRWEGSIVCRKDVFQLKKYSAVTKGEDTDLIDFLHENHYLVYLDAPYLYLYTYHNGNTWSIDHFKKIFEAGNEMPNSFSAVIQHILESNISPVRRSKYLEKTVRLFETVYS